MGEPLQPDPAMLILAAFSRHAEALAWTAERAEAAWGPVELKSPVFDFTETEYYAPTMGPGLKKIFLAFAAPFDPAELVECKLTANAWEAEYANLPSPFGRGAGGEGNLEDIARSSEIYSPFSPHPCPLPEGEGTYAALKKHPEPRPLNLDPGYLTLGKLVLASTKDFVHRIYLRSGIYAEVTLFYKHHQWRHHEYTFADYRRTDYHRFFDQCRKRLHEKIRMWNAEY